MPKDDKIKNFIIINSYLLGDTLLVNSLVQNIKKIYKNSKVIMLTNKSLESLTKEQLGVDEVLIWDRAGIHKSFWGMIKFIREFPYKNIYATFPIYGMDRPIILAFLLKSKYILFEKYTRKNLLFNIFKRTKYRINKNFSSIQEEQANLLTGITDKKIKNYKIRLKRDNIKKIDIPFIQKNKKEYIVICPNSSKLIKDMPFDTIIDIITNLTNTKIVLLGIGEKAKKQSKLLQKYHFNNLFDFTNKTNLLEAANIILNSKGVISVDTGLMHLACALDIPVTAVFYETQKSKFMPDPKLYKSTIITKDQNSKNIINLFNQMLYKEGINE